MYAPPPQNGLPNGPTGHANGTGGHPHGNPNGNQQPQWGPPPPDAHYHPQGQYSSYPPYAARSDYQNQPPHLANMRADRPEMTPVNPGYPAPQEHYRLPAPPQFYTAQPQYGHPPVQQQPPMQGSVTQSAPRQRTAIACKYCRRRKIRCSGFEASEDGRCTNCVRFSQECVFTPVSHQAQAFVPAQAVYGRGGRNMNGTHQPPQLYGAYGQRLPVQQHPQDPYGQPPPGYALPPPNGGYPPQQYPQAPPPYIQQYPPPQNPYEAQNVQAGTRRSRDEPHTPTLPPPNPGPASHLAAHGEQDRNGYAYPDPTGYVNGNASPASSTASYPTQPQPYYAPGNGRRNSPGSANVYEQPRGSNSPHGQGSYTYSAQSSQPPQGADGRTPPPNSAAQDNGANRNGVSIRDIVSNDASGDRRSTTDKDMVSALNRPVRR